MRDLKTTGKRFLESKARLLPLGVRTMVATPLLRDGAAVGAIVIRRKQVRPFATKQIALLKTFADQAAIAIENARLSQELQARNSELTEGLERETATREILSVISSSPTDVAPVFSTILEKATRLSGSQLGALYVYEGNDAFRLVASHGAKPEYVEWASREPQRFRRPSFRPGGPWRPLQILDVREFVLYREGDPYWVKTADLGRSSQSHWSGRADCSAFARSTVAKSDRSPPSRSSCSRPSPTRP